MYSNNTVKNELRTALIGMLCTRVCCGGWVSL